MKLDHTPSNIRTSTFSAWLDYCILGAEEVGRADPEKRETSEAAYHRPLTEQQQRIRLECRRSVSQQRRGVRS